MAETERFIVFTRYPKSGTTKTRLIPALGAEGAAALQRRMTERAIAHLQALIERRPTLSAEIRFTGGASVGETLAIQQQMQAWLGPQWIYQPQTEGDLGQRMAQALQQAFSEGIERSVVMGTDCPDLEPQGMVQALDALRDHDLVLGPATDGGYYLIGLNRPIPELFENIDWGTDQVFQQTLDIAQSLGLAIAFLEPLADIDRPEDLAVWERITASSPDPFAPSPALASISVVMPVCNEAKILAAAIAQIQVAAGPEKVEILVVDGGSGDETVAIAQVLDVRLLQAPLGRATQMNWGAQAATGDILLFLHADTHLPSSFPALVRQTLAQPQVVAGAFRFAVEGNLPGLRLVEWGVNWRSQFFQMPYGDQALFLKAKTLQDLGGFAELPIMEDFELVRRLKTQGRIAIAPASVLTSGRRWQKLGILQTTVMNQIIILGYFLGISPQGLARWYRGDRARR